MIIAFGPNYIERQPDEINIRNYNLPTCLHTCLHTYILTRFDSMLPRYTACPSGHTYTSKTRHSSPSVCLLSVCLPLAPPSRLSPFAKALAEEKLGLQSALDAGHS